MTSWPVPMKEKLPEPFSKFVATPSWSESKGAEPLSFCPRKTSSDWGAVAVSTFLVPPGWVGSPPGMPTPSKKMQSFPMAASGSLIVGRVKSVSLPLGYQSEGTTPSGTNIATKFSGSRRLGPRVRPSQGSCEAAPVAMALCRKLRREKRRRPAGSVADWTSSLHRTRTLRA